MTTPIDDVALIHLGSDVVSNDFCYELFIYHILRFDLELVTFPLELLLGLTKES